MFLQSKLAAQLRCWPAVVLASALITTTCFGQTAAPERPSTDQLFNYTEATTLGVAHLDVDSIDAMAMLEYAKQLTGGELPNEAQLRQGAMVVDGFLSSLRQAGANDLLITMSTEDLTRGTPAVITRTRNPQMLKGMLAMPWMPLQNRFPATMRTDDGVAVFGAEHTVQRLSDDKVTERFDQLLAEPSLDHQLMLALPDESRLDMQQLWPEQMPLQSPVQFSPRQMAKDLKSIRLAWSLPPMPEFNATLLAIDEAAALRVREVVQEAVQLGGEATKDISVSVDDTTVTIAAPSEVILESVAKSMLRLRAAARRAQRSNDFKQLALAMHNYHQVHKELPCPIVSAAWQALHSFLVRILPYLNQKALYKTIAIDESWDADANQMATRTVVPVYGEIPGNEQITTTMRIPVIKSSLWSEPETPKRFQSISDGLSNTIAFVDVPPAAETPWMKPGFWELDEDNLIDSFFGDRPGTHVALFDGAVIYLSRTIEPKMLRALLTHAGGEVINREEMK